MKNDTISAYPVELKLEMAATIFAGLCQNQELYEHCMDKQTEPSNAYWYDHMASIAIKSTNALFREYGEPRNDF